MTPSDEARSILLRDLASRPLPFGFGQEHGSYGFPLWAAYRRSDGSLVLEGAELSDCEPSLESLPLWALARLAEEGLSGDALFRALAPPASALRRGMPSEALEDADAWAQTLPLLSDPLPPDSDA